MDLTPTQPQESGFPINDRPMVGGETGLSIRSWGAEPASDRLQQQQPAPFGLSTVNFDTSNLIASTYWMQLRTTQIRFIAPDTSTVRICRSEEPLADVFSRMTDFKISSMPVFDVTLNRFIGIIDMMDILQHIIDVYDLSDRRKWPLVYSLCVEKAGPLGWMGSQNFQTTPVSVVMQRYTRSGPYRAITLNDAISDLASLFASTATLRVPVSASDNPTNLVSIITQSQLVKTLANTLPTMGPIAFQPIQSLQLIRKFAWSLVNHSISNFAISLTLLCPSEMVLGVKETQLALEAFILIAQNGVTGVAVFDLDGCVVGNISVSDLRDLGSSMEMFFKVFMTARKFIDNKISGSDAPALAFVTPATSFGDMLTKITMMGVHRVYVVERADARLPIGVIALLDIIRLFAFVQSS